MDRDQAELYRRMAELRRQVFVPDTGGYLATYYKDTAAAKLKSYAELENPFKELQSKLAAITNTAREAYLRGDSTYVWDNKSFNVRGFLNKDGTVRDLNDIVRSQQWYSTSQGKMMPGRVGKVIQDYQKTKSDFDLAAEENKKYQSLYDELMAQTASDNEKRRASFLKQQQETLQAGMATAYRGATYTEKPK